MSEYLGNSENLITFLSELSKIHENCQKKFREIKILVPLSLPASDEAEDLLESEDS